MKPSETTEFSKFETELRYYAARIGGNDSGYSIEGLGGHIDLENIQNLLNEIMNSGIYYDEFLDLVYPDLEFDPKIHGIMKKILKKLNIDIPTNYQDIVHSILSYYLPHILKDECDVVGEMQNLFEEFCEGEDYYENPFLEKALPQMTYEVGEAMTSCSIYLRSDRYLWDIDNKERKALEKNSIKTAETWLKQYTRSV